MGSRCQDESHSLTDKAEYWFESGLMMRIGKFDEC